MRILLKEYLHLHQAMILSLITLALEHRQLQLSELGTGLPQVTQQTCFCQEQP